MLKFRSLSNENLEKVLALTNSVFPREAKRGWPEMAYRASLATKKSTHFNFLKYYVAYRNSVIIGTAGLYRQWNDPKNVIWLGWFCVNPKARGNGYGRAILEYTIGKAQREGSKIFKLYTSRDPNEAVAQILYEKLGFKITHEENEPGEPYTTIFRERKI